MKSLSLSEVSKYSKGKVDENAKKIIVDSVSSFEDLIGNKISSNNSKYLLKEKLLKMNKVSMIDIDKNEYYFNNAIVNLLGRELIGDDIKINFFKSSFGNVDNDPRLRGNYIYSDQEKSLIKKGVFTTCKIKKDDCPPWQFKSEEILHDKNKKTIYYKNAWLEIYDKPVFYFPKFFHPDPTVKRQSGFLAPRFESSSSLGDSVSVPYYKVISDNKDLTFSPKIYGTNEGLFQNEYRQQNKNSSHILDFSLKKDNNSSKSHFFSRTLANLNLSYFQNSELEFNIETTSDDNYLKSHKIKSSITNNNSLLNSFLLFKGNKEDVQRIIDAAPEVVSHNMETVRRLTKKVRIQAKYERSLEVLRLLGLGGMKTKSGIMLGLGETQDEIIQTMHDLRNVGVSIMTLGQYLQPTKKHLSVFEFITPDKFDEYRKIGLKLGFKHVESGPGV